MSASNTNYHGYFANKSFYNNCLLLSSGSIGMLFFIFLNGGHVLQISVLLIGVVSFLPLFYILHRKSVHVNKKSRAICLSRSYLHIILDYANGWVIAVLSSIFGVVVKNDISLIKADITFTIEGFILIVSILIFLIVAYFYSVMARHEREKVETEKGQQ